MVATMPNKLDNLPNEMKQLKRWLLWKREVEKDRAGNIKRDSQGNEKYTKVPKQPNGYNASKTNPDHFLTFQEAMSAYQTGTFFGIGFVLVEGDPYVIIDLDDCFAENGQLTDKAKLIVDSLNSYTEISQSGNGLHIVIKGQNIEGFNNQNENVEMYSQKRYFAMTGDVFRDDLTTIEYRNETVLYLHDKYRTKNKLKQSEIMEAQPEILSDEDILVKARNAKNGKKFIDLYDKGDIYTYHGGDDSRADEALASILAWWTKNADQIERLMRNSALYRDKWDKHPDYLRGTGYTIDKALQMVKGGYSAKGDSQIPLKDSPDVDLQTELKKRRFEELDLMLAEWEANGRQGRKPSTISAIRCAEVLNEYISFILFDLEENTRVAMYLSKEGIYTRNITLIKRVISWLEPKLNSTKADDVVYHLTNMASVREKTESRYLIPVKNGVFNLKSKTLEPFNSKYVFTTKISTPYIDNPANPIIDGWDVESWLNSIACNDSEIVQLLWQVINDSLNGNYSRKKAIFLVGEGNNGKGTFQELIIHLIGIQNIATLKVNEFDERFRLSVLEGKTAVIGDDVPANVYIDDSSNFNSVVTGDRVQVEFKNKPLYTAVFRCSVIQSTNGMPKFRNKTNGTIRRIVIAPFNADFNGKEENFKIKDEYIRNEKVLQYVLHKAINMDFDRFNIPEVSKMALEVFKQDNDPVYDFKLSVFDEWNIPKVPKYIVYGFYKKFCNDNGYKHLSDRQFHKQFKTYLGDEWDTDAQCRFSYDSLINYVGDLDKMDLGFGFPDHTKNQKSYENTRLKIM